MSSCPCARVPLSLSSATSAEYGDIVSLARRIRANNNYSSSSTNKTLSSSSSAESSIMTFLDGGRDASTVSSSSTTTRPNITMNGDGGITPLHLAAQHGHAEAVYLLLTEGKKDVNTGLCSSSITTMTMSHNSNNDNVTSGSSSEVGRVECVTPLHRAAFSGAISSMRVLLSWNNDNDNNDDNDNTTRRLQRYHRRTTADILAKDTSYGDLRTPLHKAIAGGRPLAVQLLLSTLHQRQLLTKALHTKDGMGKTPLTLARQYGAMTIDEIEVERSSVRRWDVVAGGDCADWSTCLRLLENAVAASTADATEMQPHLLLQPTKTTTTTILDNEFLDGSNKGYLTKCNDNNVGIKCQDVRCRTAIWEESFRLALASSIETLLNNNNNNNNKYKTSKSVEKEMVNEEKEMTIVDCSIIENNPTFIKQDGLTVESTMDHITDMTKHDMEVSPLTTLIESNNTPKLTDMVLGRQCDSCGKYSTTLYRLTVKNNQQQQLVCRQCHRRRHR